jgi:glycosyl transferase family 87
MTSKRDGGSLLLYLVCAGCLIIVTLFFMYGYEKTWRLWNIPTLEPYLYDARVITAGAEAHALGYDPLINNPGFTRMNYPRVWQLLFYLGIDQSDTIYFGLVFAALFFFGVFLIARNIDRPTAWLMTCAIFSPAVLLGLERGNCDLLVFFLLALAVYLVKKSRVGTAIVIAFAFLLKLFPVFALAVFLRENKKVFRAIMVSSIVLCGIYAMVMLGDLRLIREATPKPQNLAYGVDVAWTEVMNHHFLHAAVALRIVSYLAVVLVAAFSLFHAGWRVDAESDCDGHMDSLRVGAASYIGTFLLGGNWDYRLMILLLVIPQLMSWRRSPSKSVRYTTTTTLVCVIISLWSWFARRLLAHLLPVSFLLDLFSKWIVFSGLMYLFVYSCPNWLKLWLPRAKAGAPSASGRSEAGTLPAGMSNISN